MQNNKQGQMRLQREAKMAKKDLETQIKKTHKINDGFICLPDPDDAFTWYYIIFGLDMKEYEGGFYMGKVVCPPEYPAKPPKICPMTENGRFHTWDEGICLSISSYHPESWNPVWKVNQVVLGLFSFWQQNDEYTYGAIEDGELRLNHGESMEDRRISLAKKSREACLKHDKFKIFEKYAKEIGIDQEPQGIEQWIAHGEKMAKIEAEEEERKRIAEERKRKEEEARKLAQQKAEEEAKLQAELEKKQQMQKIPADFFKQINKMGLTQHIGQG